MKYIWMFVQCVVARIRRSGGCTCDNCYADLGDDWSMRLIPQVTETAEGCVDRRDLVVLIAPNGVPIAYRDRGVQVEPLPEGSKVSPRWLAKNWKWA